MLNLEERSCQNEEKRFYDDDVLFLDILEMNLLICQSSKPRKNLYTSRSNTFYFSFNYWHIFNDDTFSSA